MCDSARRKNPSLDIDITTNASSDIDAQNEIIKKLQDNYIKLQNLLDDKKLELNQRNKEIIELKQRVFSLEDALNRSNSTRNDILDKYTEGIITKFEQNLQANFENVINIAVDKLFISSTNEVNKLIEVKSAEVITCLKQEGALVTPEMIKNYFKDLHIKIETVFKNNFSNHQIVKGIQENISNDFKEELNRRTEEFNKIKAGWDRNVKEKNNLISELDKDLKKCQRENESLKQGLELYKSKFENARLLLNNVFTTNLDQEFFQPLIENCFPNKELDVEETQNLIKSIKVNIVVKVYNYILVDILKAKLINFLPLHDILHEINCIDFNFNSKDDLYKFTELIRVDDSNIINRLMTQILKSYDEKIKECNISLDRHVNSKYQIINLQKENEDLRRQLQKEEVQEVQKHTELEEDLNALSQRNEILLEENKKIKTKTKEVLLKVKNEFKDAENLIDRRIVTSFLLKALDKKTKKKIRMSVLDTFSTFLGLNNDERKIIGLAPANSNHLNYTSYYTEKVKLPDDLLNFVNHDN